MASRPPARATTSAKALLLTILGEFVLPRAGRAWTQSLVDGLAVLGVGERNARQAIARTADHGFIESERVGRRARWRLTVHGRELLTAGTERIYGFGSDGAEWDDRWLVVVCAVPEDQRAKRHHLRSRLAFAGFGFLTPTIAISPHTDREQLANAVLRDLDLAGAGVVFRAEAGSLTPARDLLSRAWDLDGLAAEYDAFVVAFGERRPSTDHDRFAALVELVHGWRRFPFVDPEIPERLLPDHWPGRPAKRTFDERHEQWGPGANALFDSFERTNAHASTETNGSA
ncbi:MAG TPA: PaaX family transcriptional regulator C-terminal domain-containing protein [Ilumatobacteraceae bacterium]|nr:PaaX family transcriptional regulator C-terminal domain-containing protein [Ilumatobacteraceae bacterium]